MNTIKCLKCGAIYPSDMNRCPSCNCDKDNTKEIKIVKTTPNPKGYYRGSSVEAHQHTSKIICPYCQSANCKKISALSKVGSVALWGIFAFGKTTKQWHCNSCKSDF